MRDPRSFVVEWQGDVDLNFCPQGCGGMTEDAAGGPCKACWSTVGRGNGVLADYDRCNCAGCIGMGPCDDGTECSYGCGRRAANQWGTCGSCEDEAQGLDLADEDDES